MGVNNVYIKISFLVIFLLLWYNYSFGALIDSVLPPDSVPEENISTDSLLKEFDTAKTRDLQELVVKRKHQKYSKKIIRLLIL